MVGAGSAVAENCFRRAMMLAESQKARLFELRAATELSILLVKCGQRHEIRNVLLPICASLTEGFGNADIKRARKVLDHSG
jgi:hypothetical protein